mgnify:CR=1 FL=1
MAKQAIGIGSTANDGTGDTIRDSFDKVNDNFNELYGGESTITATTGTINLDASANDVFRLTSDLTGATTFNIQNMRAGQMIDIIVSGSQTITFTSDDTTETFNKVGSNDYDGASDNHIQVLCVDDIDSAAIYNYSVATFTSDTTP